MPVIEQLKAMEILDSRGRPTVKCWCTLASGASASASVPSGASTGRAEAMELRDGEERYGGMGCRNAVANVNGEIAARLRGREMPDQAVLDRALIELDGTPQKSRLGANAILAVSLAFCRAHAAERRVPLYRHLAELRDPARQSLPRTTINLFSGGKHAGGQVAIQDVLVVPAHAATIAQSLELTAAVYASAVDLIDEQYAARALKADEGGLAPPFHDTETALRDAVEAIRRADLTPGEDVALAVDVASSHFFRDGRYLIDGNALTAPQMIELLARWAETYPIVSIEDGLAEDDWDQWPHLRETLDARGCLTLGDDFLCTNPSRIERAAASRSCTALLLKVNQIGTLTEAAEACRLARGAGWHVTVSARSGETEDDWLADLATAWGDQIKVGSIAQSERLAKYNRLLEIEAETQWPVIRWPR
jgi:enolase